MTLKDQIAGHSYLCPISKKRAGDLSHTYAMEYKQYYIVVIQTP